MLATDFKELQNERDLCLERPGIEVCARRNVARLQLRLERPLDAPAQSYARSLPVAVLTRVMTDGVAMAMSVRTPPSERGPRG
jgi:hypothetical protein